MYAVSPRRITPIVVGDAIRRGEMASTRREDHEVSMLALHLLQNYMVYYINTLMISPERPLRGAQQPVGAGWRPSATDSLLSFNTPRHYIHL